MKIANDILATGTHENPGKSYPLCTKYVYNDIVQRPKDVPTSDMIIKIFRFNRSASCVVQRLPKICNDAITIDDTYGSMSDPDSSNKITA